MADIALKFNGQRNTIDIFIIVQDSISRVDQQADIFVGIIAIGGCQRGIIDRMNGQADCDFLAEGNTIAGLVGEGVRPA